ncbi:hypothetical protein FRB94_014058 [Tulasnella sp. JGI-2019a]|nr:hypothetical protein FRB93_013958 [Tulasnella sp. JGI-2019a]KAG9007730.1 hypothetical protein FRB94_014058 [Tulasnella sp. JGI-2019a]KAG9034924.1 hypothetical protein FRB95_012340 [Tulasnella sp. JGI-2019a]
MAPIGHVLIFLSRRQTSDGTTSSLSSSGNSVIYIVGIVVICIAMTALLGWLGLKYWQGRKVAAIKADAEIVDAYMEKEDVFKSEGMAVAALEKHRAPIVSADVKPLPPSPSRSPSGKPRVRSSSLGTSGRPYSGMSTAPSSRSRLRISHLPQDMKNRSSTATTAENELIDYHLSQGTMPVAFAPILAEIPSSPTSARHASVTINQAKIVTIPKISPGPLALRPQSSDNSGGHFRFGSFSASIRNSLNSLSTPSPTKSVFNFGIGRKRTESSIPVASPDNQRTIVITSFSPLLPDELVLKPGVEEKVTVVQSFDDGWCIVARTNLGELEVGAVPEWVFGLAEGEDEMFNTMRPMRSTSLGVTVDLRVVEAAGEKPKTGSGHFSWALASMTDQRASMISWSNF